MKSCLYAPFHFLQTTSPLRMVTKMAPLARILGATLATATAISASPLALTRRQNGTSPTGSQCPGYRASDVQTSAHGLTAKLTLAGAPCNIYGTDLEDLTVTVEYQTGKYSDCYPHCNRLTRALDNRLHVLIQDAAQQVYQVPESVFPRPAFTGVDAGASSLLFDYVENPFSFRVKRQSTDEVLFDTSAASLIFEDQYVRLRTFVPESPSLYGTGEHTDPL